MRLQEFFESHSSVMLQFLTQDSKKVNVNQMFLFYNPYICGLCVLITSNHQDKIKKPTKGQK